MWRPNRGEQPKHYLPENQHGCRGAIFLSGQPVPNWLPDRDTTSSGTLDLDIGGAGSANASRLSLPQIGALAFPQNEPSWAGNLIGMPGGGNHEPYIPKRSRSRKP